MGPRCCGDELRSVGRAARFGELVHGLDGLRGKPQGDLHSSWSFVDVSGAVEQEPARDGWLLPDEVFQGSRLGLDGVQDDVGQLALACVKLSRPARRLCDRSTGRGPAHGMAGGVELHDGCGASVRDPLPTHVLLDHGCQPIITRPK
jgi:hypothetical protein